MLFSTKNLHSLDISCVMVMKSSLNEIVTSFKKLVEWLEFFVL